MRLLWGPREVPSASDVRREYDSRIAKFLERVGEPRPSRLDRRKDLLSTVFEWSLRIQSYQENADQKLAEKVQDYDKLQREHRDMSRKNGDLEGKVTNLQDTIGRERHASHEYIDNLNKTHQAEVFNLHAELDSRGKAHNLAITQLQTTLASQRQQHASYIERMKKEHESHMANLKGDFERRMASEQADHSAERDSIRTQLVMQRQAHARETTALKDEHRRQTTELEDEHQRQTTVLEEKHKAKYNRLLDQLLVNSEDDLEWPDDRLKHEFQKLIVNIHSISSPQRPEFKIPAHCHVAPELDPTGIIQRHGQGKSYWLLKYSIWGILQEHFFSLPFGFGAYGTGNAPVELLKALRSWARLWESEDNDPSPESEVGIFDRNVLANRWRTVTFQSIETARSDEGLESHGTIYGTRETNLAAAEHRIIDYLEAIAALGGNRVSEDVEKDVKTVVKVAQQVAIQFGIHSAKLIILNPAEPIRNDPSPGLLKIIQDKEQGTIRNVIVECRDRRGEVAG